MRHRVFVGRKSFGRSYNHKKAVLKNLIFSLIKYGRIKTTLAKAKELKRHADKVITLGKKKDLNSYRQLLSKYPNKTLISDVVNRLAPKFFDRNGGYTRIIKCADRVGDNASMAFIEWVESDLILTKDQKKSLDKKKKKVDDVISKKSIDAKKPEVKEVKDVKEIKEDAPISKQEPSESLNLLERIKRYWFLGVILIALIAAALFFIRSCQEKENTSGDNQDILSQLEQVGASNFVLPRVTDDRLVSLSEFRGNITIVNFWATWCAPCVEEFGSMLELVDKFQGQIKILAISMDNNKKDIINFMNAFEVSTPDLVVLHDLNQHLAKEWGTLKLPESYILNQEHKLIRKVASTANWSSPSVLHYFSSLL